MSREKVIEIACGELGVCEEPVNRVKYNTAYYGREVSGKEYKWCVVFLWWVFQQAGERMSFFGGGKTASCGTLLRWYREQGLTVPVDQVKVGDIVILNFSGTKDTEHCGYVIERAGNTIKTVEGNTSPGEEGSQSNGGCVAQKTRLPYQIVDVCRPQYKEDPVITDEKPDYAGHWAEKSILKAMDKEIMKGYPDGSFRPNDTPTRAELAVILDRLGLLD